MIGKLIRLNELIRKLIRLNESIRKLIRRFHVAQSKEDAEGRREETLVARVRASEKQEAAAAAAAEHSATVPTPLYLQSAQSALHIFVVSTISTISVCSQQSQHNIFAEEQREETLVARGRASEKQEATSAAAAEHSATLPTPQPNRFRIQSLNPGS